MHIQAIGLAALSFASSVVAAGDAITLKAASVKLPLARRDASFVPSIQRRDVFYSEGQSSHAGHGVVAKVEFTPDLPAVLIEEIDWSLRDLACSYAAIRLDFHHPDSCNKARDAWSKHQEFYIISSHSQCNEDGHRAAFLVSEVHSLGSKALTLESRPVPWQQMAKDVVIDFGKETEAPKSLWQPSSDHLGLKRRQQPTPTSSTTPSASPLPLQGYPNAPTGSPAPQNSTGVAFDQRITNKTILPPEIDGINYLNPFPIPNAVFRCLNCSITGQLDFKYGQITLGNFNTTARPDNGFDFISNGFFEVDFNNLQASIDLETIIAANVPLSSWSAPLPTVPLTPFSILGIAAIGPVFAPVIEGSLAAGNQMSFKYGLDFNVPNNSSIQLDIAELRNSKVTGFNATTFKVHPVSTNVSEPAVQMSITFKPQIRVGIDFLGQVAGVGLYANLPQLKLDIKQVAGVNKKCEKSTNVTANGTITDNVFGYFAGNLTQITPSVNLEVGVNENIILDQVPFLADDQVLLTVSNFMPVPTTCLSWNNKASALTPIPAYNTGQPRADDAATTSATSLPPSGTVNASASKVTSHTPSPTKSSDGGIIISAKLKATLTVFGLVNILVAALL